MLAGDLANRELDVNCPSFKVATTGIKCWSGKGVRTLCNKRCGFCAKKPKFTGLHSAPFVLRFAFGLCMMTAFMDGRQHNQALAMHGIAIWQRYGTA